MANPTTGTLLRALRSGRSLRETAALLGCCERLLQLLEADTRIPSKAMMTRILVTFGEAAHPLLAACNAAWEAQEAERERRRAERMASRTFATPHGAKDREWREGKRAQMGDAAYRAMHRERMRARRAAVSAGSNR